MSSPTRVGVLLSGRGSNFLALHAATRDGRLPEVEIVQVLSNVEDAPGLEAARRLGLAAKAIPHRGVKRREHDRLMVAALREAEVEWVCLAGYMRLLTSYFVEAYSRRMLNIHPSLLPAFPGLSAQRQAWDYGVSVSGCTVHLVDEAMDSGPIVAQAAVDISDCAGPREVADRILEQEHRLYPQALSDVIRRRWSIQGRRLTFSS